MKNDILKNKFYLYLTEFFSGVSVMAVELAASRFMAPYFSSSQIVYTIIIGTVMIAMALGNLYGGKTADRNPDPAILYRRMLAAAAWIAAIPLLGRYVILAISGILVISVNTNFLTIAAFAACIIIFVYPLFLLGTVTPSLVRYIMEDASQSGEIVGRLGACNTIGSIIGTFLPTFVTIPAVGTAATFIIFSSVLAVISLAYFISARKIGKTSILLLIIIILCIFFGSGVSFAFWEDGLEYEGESVYNYLQVNEDDRQTVLSTNVLFGVQSVKMKEEGLTGMYYDYALAAPAMTEPASGEHLKILILGNGTGTFATQCARYYPGSEIDAVEIDGKISELAYEYFDMSRDINLSEYDGRAYLNAIGKKYDVILVDAYQDITIPFQMSSVEFFTLVREHLNENGIMIVNMNMHSDGNESINAYLTDTIASVFKYVYSADVPLNSNREVFACAGRDPKDALGASPFFEDGSELGTQLGKIYARMISCKGGSRILTDDKAPVEVLGMQMIDKLINEELAYYKDIYKTQGLNALINSLL